MKLHAKLLSSSPPAAEVSAVFEKTLLRAIFLSFADSGLLTAEQCRLCLGALARQEKLP